MTEPNNVVNIDFKSKKKISTEVTTNLIEQSLPSKTTGAPEDTYKKFVTDSTNANKIEFIMAELMKIISSQYPDIMTCRFGDVLFLKEGVISLIMRALLNENHPFQNMADGLEKAFNKVDNNDSTK